MYGSIKVRIEAELQRRLGSGKHNVWEHQGKDRGGATAEIRIRKTTAVGELK